METSISKCFLGNDTWCKSPSQTINYASCHDNNTLFDRLQLSRPDADFADLVKMNNLAAAIYLTAEGVPFMQAGEEMLRSKPNGDGTYNSNSYNAGDTVNAIDYSCLGDDSYAAVFDYYKGLIAFRKAHAALRLSTAEDVAAHVTTLGNLDAQMVGYEITGGMDGESAEEIYLVFNANDEDKTIPLPDGDWNVYINSEKAGTTPLETISGEATVGAISALVLVKETGVNVSADASETSVTEIGSTGEAASDSASSPQAAVIVLICIAAVAVLVAVVLGMRASKKKQ
jgi:pullulanase